LLIIYQLKCSAQARSSAYPRISDGSTIIGTGDGSEYGSSLPSATIKCAGDLQKKQFVNRTVDVVRVPYSSRASVSFNVVKSAFVTATDAAASSADIP
jgi:hypothetical protein